MVRVPELQDPLFDFGLDFEFLRDRSATDELATLLQFFEQRQGAFDSFLLNLPDLTQNPLDGAAEGIALAADGNMCVPMLTAIGETIYEANDALAWVLKNNGTTLVQNIDYTLYNSANTASGELNANGIAYRGWVAKLASSVTPGTITGDLAWYYRVRFAHDSQDFEAFSYQLYEAQSVKLTTARE
jgi:hypothetical protein